MKVKLSLSKPPQPHQLRRVFFLMIFSLFVPETVFGELSLTNKMRVQEATRLCEKTNNKIRYQEYWKDTVSKETDAVVCMAEQMADLIVAESDVWLEEKGVALIENCTVKADKDMHVYYLCLQKNLDQMTRNISSPCIELGREQLWGEKQCNQLVSFLLMSKFEVILQKNISKIKKVHASIDKIKDVKAVRTILNPLLAFIFFYILSLVLVLVIDKGNWMRVSKWGLITGPFIIVSCFFQGGWRFFLAGIAIGTIVIYIIMIERETIVKHAKKIGEKN